MYKIATDEMAIVALRNVFAKQKSVSSQRRLKCLVDKELASSGDPYKVGERRLRLLVLAHDMARIEMDYREVESKRAISLCPVCRQRLSIAKNMTVFGGTVTLGYRCKKCGYSTGAKRKVPVRYTFFRRG
ncbi:MAG: hypothetical protein AB1665_03640 [Candidatus Thermoplasmatota archaeon]